MRAGFQTIKPEKIAEFQFERKDVNEEEIEALREDIEKNEQTQNVVVTPSSDGELKLIAGYRRYLAVKESDKIDELKAEVRKDVDGKEYSILWGENLLDEDFTDYDKMRLVAQMKSENMTQEEIAEKLDKSQAWVSQYLSKWESDSPVKDAISKAEISEKQARHIQKLPEDNQKEAIKEAKGKTVEQTKEMVDEQKTAKARKELQEKIKEQKEKLEEIEGAKERKEEVDERKEVVRAKQDELQDELEGEIKEKVNLVEDIQENYLDLQDEIEIAKTELEQIKEEFSEIDVEEVKEERKEAKEEREEAKDEIEELQAELKKARKKRDNHDDVVIQKNKAIRNYDRQMKKIEDKKEEIEDDREDLKKFEKKHEEDIDNFDELKAEVLEESEEVVEGKEELREEELELISETRSLVGKINNEGNVEDKLNELQADLEALEPAEGETEDEDNEE